MNPFRRFCLAFTLCCSAIAAPGQQSVSSDDISVADGLQLPTYGHIWALDAWEKLPELVRLRPPAPAGDGSGFSWKLHRTIAFEGEAARVRLHGTSPVFFIRGISGAAGRSDLIIVRLENEGQRRVVTRAAAETLKQQNKHPGSQTPSVLSTQQKTVGSADWYRVWLDQPLSPGEYALLPLASSQGFADGEIFDFAIDPSAPENADPLRSEQYQQEKTAPSASDQ